MKIQIAGFTASKYRENLILRCCNKRLLSYHFISEDLKTSDRKGSCQYYSFKRIVNMKIKRRNTSIKRRRIVKPELFIDSGAFSAWSQNTEIDIYKYIEFIKRYEKYIDYYAVLDSIGSPEKTLQNQIIMEGAGLKPMPCFHYGENERYLKEYLRYPIIALGGMVPIPTVKLRPWLDHLFTEYLCDKNGMPIIKVHGFGMTAIPLMVRYPWYSVDSTSWVATSRFGGILVPKFYGENFNYLKPLKIDVSTRVKKGGLKDGQHLDTLTTLEKKKVIEYIKKTGYPLGKSTFTWNSPNHELEADERWASKLKDNKRLLEKIIEPGITNDYHYRDQFNIDYFVKLEKSLPQWPWAFKLKKKKGFNFR